MHIALKVSFKKNYHHSRLRAIVVGHDLLTLFKPVSIFEWFFIQQARSKISADMSLLTLPPRKFFSENDKCYFGGIPLPMAGISITLRNRAWSGNKFITSGKARTEER